ncbi:insulinase family protein [Candidatus Saccharibacteria bacterium]|nr:insulinase family protein [Candidatus Saccharibacteria bacterium]
MALTHAVEEVTLHSGARGIIIKIPGVHTVYTTYAFRAGAQYLSDELCQVPHIIEHMAFTSPGAFTSQEEFSREFTKHSASEDAMTDEAHVTYEATCSLSEYERIVALMGKVIAEPTFTQEHFDVEKSTVLEELTSNLNNDGRIFWQTANRMSGGGGRKDQEKIDSLATTTVEDVRKFYAESHVSDNLRFVIAGDVQTQDVVRLLEAWPLERGARPGLRQDMFETLRKPVLLERPQYGTLDFSLSLLTPGLLSHEEDVAWNFVNHLLFRTYHSRVFGQLRSKGVCYDIGASYVNMMYNYRELEVYGSASSEHIEETIAHVAKEFTSLANGGLTEDEVDEVRAYIMGYQERLFESPGEVAGYYEGQYLLNETYVPDTVILDIIKKITREAIVEYANEWLYKSKSRFGLTGNVDAAQAERLQDIVNNMIER